jgi:hypothetical protein
MKLRLLFTLLIAISLRATACSDDSLGRSSYRVENIELPKGLAGQVGALAFLPNGNLVAAFIRGEVMTFNPNSKTWSVFATGLHDPLGIQAISNSEIWVMQFPELTRIVDTDGDGKADLYETVTDKFGMTGNFHEFAYGPVKDQEENVFVALNSASPNGGIRKEVRGKLDTTAKAPVQMFSVVPYRGWVMKRTPDGKLHPYASGFRSPNGLGFDLNNNLLVTDNQGDWIPTSALHHVQEGRFYGHPSSLIWTEGWNKGNPMALDPSELNRLRTPAAVLFPHGIMANSPTQPLCDATQGKFGPFQGQIFVGEMNQERIVRVMLEEVDGELQGACIPFIDKSGLRKGNNRLAFAPDGSLYTGQNDHGWAGDKGIQRIVFTGKTPADIQNMELTKDGFTVTFTLPMNREEASNPNNYQFRHYFYEYHKKYGSDQFDVQSVPVLSVELSSDGLKATLRMDTIKAGYIYELKLNNLPTESGQQLSNSLICYTVNKVRK